MFGPGWLWGQHWFFALLFTAWFLLIWSVFGGAIARIAAVHVARDEKLSVRQSVRFSSGKALSFLFAPLIPLLIILGIGAVLALAGFVLFHIPIVGPIVAGLFFILALLGGLVMALVLLGTLGGFNLMYPTIAAEGSDSFDAISRSFSYVFARPWRMLWYTIVTLVYGGICYLFVRFFIFLILYLTQFFVGWWLTSDQTKPYYPLMFPPPSMDQLAYHPGFEGLKWSEDIAAFCIAVWNYLLISLLGAFAISFYFSSSTIMYFLMRREVDATELEDVYQEDADDELADVPPLATAPAAAPATAPAATPVTTVTTIEAPPATETLPPPDPTPRPETPPSRRRGERSERGMNENARAGTARAVPASSRGAKCERQDAKSRFQKGCGGARPSSRGTRGISGGGHALSSRDPSGRKTPLGMTLSG